MPRIQAPPKNNKIISKKFPELKRYLPCFFDVPLRMALEILGLSHHTLDPIRRSLDLERWPYAELTRGKLFIKGVKWQREDIVALRTQMLPEADKEMQRVLCVAATRADEFWNYPIPVKIIAKKKKTAELVVVPVVPVEVQTLPEAPSVWGDPANDTSSDTDFWNEIARLFSLQVALLQEDEPAAVPPPALY